MKKVDIVIENGTILTMDSQENRLENGFLCITGDHISHMGADISNDAFEAEKRIDARGGLVMPGLINCHTHAAMSLFRGLADDLPLMEWLNNYIFPAESMMDAGFVHTGSLLACAEMILSGTTTFCDMYLFEDEVAKAAHKIGMRCLVGEVLYDFPSPNYGPPEKGLEYSEMLIKKWEKDPLVNIAV
ncbi:MAG: amidohydrolase family protein, partial [Deltaproteobacteria bacterium]|nr:amidohydrolase family protein [Deltaproteobacteria bacterium]